MHKAILVQAKKIAQEGGEEKLIKAEELLLDHLKVNPHDTDAWLLLARIEYNSPLEDQLKIVEYCNCILSYDPHNAYALLILVETYKIFLGGIDPEIFAKLCHAQSEDLEVLAMIELAKSRYFKGKDETKYLEALQRSITYSAKQQINCFELGIYYFNHGNRAEGLRLLRQGIENVKEIDGAYDPTSLEGWFNYYYKGTHLTQWHYDVLLESLNDAMSIYTETNHLN